MQILVPLLCYYNLTHLNHHDFADATMENREVTRVMVQSGLPPRSTKIKTSTGKSEMRLRYHSIKSPNRCEPGVEGLILF